MKHRHFIGMDTHCQFCEVAVVDRSGRLVLRQRCPTGVPALLAVLEQVPRPRALVIEEGPLAGWLWRHLQAAVDEMVVSEPRRNRLIAQEGDKDDDLDAEKLAQLLRGGFLKAVHQVPTLERAVFKQRVALYHHRVRQRVREALRISSLFRQHGVMVREKDFAAAAGRPALLERLPPVAALREMVTQLWVGYDALVEQEEHWRKELIARAQEEEVVRRFRAVPGIGWIRAATWYAYLDTPGRFRSKAALWKYLGIGLERHKSGNGPEHLGVPARSHRLLKGTLLAAALSAVVAGDNPFADLYQRWRDQGLGAKLARRNVARAQAATLWGLWKNGSAYRPEWVGVAAAAPAARPVSG
ncbi:MAG TPA: IS110 family transposase [Candidatus Sulfotelmatobacter sp.]|jgi:transposase|nr:IS110 family transposase [Candidatus Sulfotelmatobacter sp.]